jgi:hypothetical protein
METDKKIKTNQIQPSALDAKQQTRVYARTTPNTAGNITKYP